MPVPSFVLEVLPGPGLDKDPLGFLQTCLGLVMVDAETLVIVDIVGGAAAETDDEAPLSDIVEDSQLFGKTDRVMQRGLHDGKADLAVPGRGGQCAGKADRVDVGADPVEMMLGEPYHIDPKFVGEPRLAQGLVD